MKVQGTWPKSYIYLLLKFHKLFFPLNANPKKRYYNIRSFNICHDLYSIQVHIFHNAIPIMLSCVFVHDNTYIIGAILFIAFFLVSIILSWIHLNSNKSGAWSPLDRCLASRCIFPNVIFCVAWIHTRRFAQCHFYFVHVSFHIENFPHLSLFFFMFSSMGSLKFHLKQAPIFVSF